MGKEDSAMGQAEEAAQEEASQEAAAAAEADGAEQAEAAGEGADGEPADRNGQPGINREKYRRDIERRDAKIAELQGRLDEAAKTEQGRADLKKELEALKAESADKELTWRLEAAGCVNAKAAKAVLPDYGGDVGKLRDACPYLFGKQKQTGTTSAAPAGASHGIDERIDAVFARKG